MTRKGGRKCAGLCVSIEGRRRRKRGGRGGEEARQECVPEPVYFPFVGSAVRGREELIGREEKKKKKKKRGNKRGKRR